MRQYKSFLFPTDGIKKERKDLKEEKESVKTGEILETRKVITWYFGVKKEEKDLNLKLKIHVTGLM